ncbi:MAG: hypothetical protein KDA86_27915, partial [Planctomycetaceae bacterium]|nr:hypothetical protein [Planctomycetaceae bacterium]
MLEGSEEAHHGDTEDTEIFEACSSEEALSASHPKIPPSSLRASVSPWCNLRHTQKREHLHDAWTLRGSAIAENLTCEMRSFYGLVAVAGAFVAFGCGSEATFGDAGGGGSSSTTASGGTSSVGGAGTGAGETGGMAGTGGMGTGGSPPLGDPIE